MFDLHIHHRQVPPEDRELARQSQKASIFSAYLAFASLLLAAVALSRELFAQPDGATVTVLVVHHAASGSASDVRDTLPSGQLDASTVAKRLGYTERHLLRSVAYSRWDDVPEPAGTYGRIVWWHEKDVDDWLLWHTPRLRRDDVAQRIGLTAGHFKDRVRRGRFDTVPEPTGHDERGQYWEAYAVDFWLAGRSPQSSR